jgi:virulence factor Mce-like protein
MSPRRRSSLAGSPLLIGGVTTLIAVVAVFLSYNANNGLPFVPTYNLKIVLPETSELQPNNQVRIAGTRVGVISSLTPHQSPTTGRVTAIADLKLEKKYEPLPANTKAVVQSTSSIGTKYLELERGTSQQTLKAGATIPVSQTREPVDLNQFFDMFDQKTRIAIEKNTINFGDSLAARGLGLNETIATLRPLVINAIPVLHNLAAPKTGFGELWRALDRPAAQTAPVAQQNANFWSDLDTFFRAWASVAPSLEQAIEGGAPALQQATYSLPYEAPFMEKSAEFMRLLRPTASGLRTIAQPLAHALGEGAVNLSAATALNTELANAAKAFQAFAQNPVVTLGLEDLTQTTTLGNPLVAGLAPEQVTCNYLTLGLRNFASLLSENIGVGTLARVLPVLSPDGVNAEGFPSSAPASGPSIDRAPGVFGKAGEVGPPINDNHLHYNPYPNVAGPGQPQECEAGNETYAIGQTVIGHAPGNAGTAHEATTRELDLYGQPYPSSTLKALGVEGAKEKAAKEKKQKEKEKKQKEQAKKKKKKGKGK